MTSTPCTLHVAWDDRLAAYDFGPGHPLAPVRVELTIELARALGVLSGPGVSRGVAAAGQLVPAGHMVPIRAGVPHREVSRPGGCGGR
jgi:hypothetical protein